MTKDFLASFWFVVQNREKKQQRTKRQRDRQKEKRQSCIKNRLSKMERFLHQASKQTVEDCRLSQRRAILINAQGLLAPVKLLPYTTDPLGVVGSFFGEKPTPLAYKALGPRSKLLMMGPNRDYAIEWDIKPYRLVEYLDLTPLVNKIRGSALILKMSLNHFNMPFVDDFPLIKTQEYTEQQHTPYTDPIE